MDGRHSSGGSQGLAQLIDEYGEFIAADFQEYYGVDLRDIFDPKARLTPLWVLLLLKGLPEGSRFVAEKRGGQHFRGWDATRYATVSLVNAVRALQWTYVAAHSKSKPKQPDPFPMPESLTKKRKPNAFALTAAAKLAKVRKVDV